MSRCSKVATGTRFFEHLRSITTYVALQTWDHLLRFIAESAVRPPWGRVRLNT
jgi:hypothetical protein